MSFIISEILKHKKELFLMIIMVIISSICSMLIPINMKILIDEIIPTKDFQNLIPVTGRMLIYTLFILLSGMSSAKCASYISMSVGKNMRSEVFRKVQYFSNEEMDKFTTSSLISRTNSDISQVQIFLSSCLKIIFMAPIFCVVGTIMSIITSKNLSIILLIAVPAMGIIIAIIGFKTIPLSNVLQEKLDKINMIIREKLTGVRVIRAFGTINFEEKRFENVNSEYTDINLKLGYINNLLRPIIDLIISAAVVAILLYAYFDLKNNGTHYTIGNIMAVVQYIMLIMLAVTLIIVALLMLPRTITCANRAKAVIDSISNLKEKEVTIKPNEKKGYISFKNVTFTYEGAEKPAIHNLSFDAGPGEVTAIIGGTGMGKSSIINLIPRFYDTSSGDIYIDDINIKDYSFKDLRSKIGIVPQKAVLFKGTIESNLKFGDFKASEEMIETAAEISKSAEFIEKKEKKYDDDVAQGGTNFSGGQKQRLCIARALVRKPEIYIFDDSFSALDLKTDKMLRKDLKEKASKNSTTIIVAQRVSTIIDADRIIVVDDGEVAGIGKHEELLNTCKVYKEIVDSQLSKEDMKNGK